MNNEKPQPIPRWKRFLDLSCVFLALPLWLPLMIAISLWIKAASKGPVFFRQQRVGYRGRHFSCLKFRSMKVDAETRTHENYVQTLIATDAPMIKMDAKGDARLIPFGKILRVFGLDELPQIFNVLRGEMSLVGPRPCTIFEFQHFRPEHKERVNAPPGLTGLWQVNGKNRTTFSEMIDMDIRYGKTMSLSLDLRIMVKTVPALIVQALESRAAKAEGKTEVAFSVVGPKQSRRVPSGLQQLR
jgi:lipopolysaccharide/colanic/teichoic acid biosynthesis glycosyltransferase